MDYFNWKRTFSFLVLIQISGIAGMSSPLFESKPCLCSIQGLNGHHPDCNCDCKNHYPEKSGNELSDHCKNLMKELDSQAKAGKNSNNKVNKGQKMLIQGIPCHPQKQNANLSFFDQTLQCTNFCDFPILENLSEKLKISSPNYNEIFLDLKEKPS
jgi:hypothetical protein